MRKLNRPQSAPTGLANYDYRTQKWNSRRPSKACRADIWQKFHLMQGNFCAFCEKTAYRGNGHIEHFFHKGRKRDGSAPYKHLTFTWNNLFGCCGTGTSSTCGHYKDRQGNQGPGEYEPNDLVKPDVDDPASFFNFLDTGVIEAKEGLSAQDKNRAEETIRVLNLSAITALRKRQIDIVKRELNALEELSSEISQQEFSQEFDKIKNRVKQQEYQTAVLSALF